MWTKKGASTAGSGFLLLVLGILYNNYIYLFLGLLFLTAIISVFLNIFDFKLEIKRSIEYPRIFQGEETNVRIQIKNKGLLTGFIEVSDSLPTRVTITEGNYSCRTYLKPGEEVNIEYKVCGHLRGHFLIGPIVLRQRDNLGFFYKDTIIESYSDLAVMPSIEELSKLTLAERTQKTFHGHTNIKDVGEGTEFYSLRDYLPGDPFKKINWKSFAKFDKLIVNQFEMEHTAEVFLIVDSRFHTGIGTIFLNPLEASVKAAASITSHFIAQKKKVGIAIYGNIIEFVKPALGERQMNLIFDMLMDARAMGSLSIRSVLQLVIPHIKPRIPIFIFSPAEFDDEFLPVVEELVVRGFKITLISPSFPEIEHANGRLSGLDYELAKMRRENLIKELRYTGVKVVDWNPLFSLASAIAGGGS
ncbi:MAG TPA: DUF58 domain-containing protein [Thermoplasmata archaeon]|nr:DUF58 domain-containing protein [Thermoplasmata archaeon]